MARFSGKQYKGASRDMKRIRRDEAEARQKDYIAARKILDSLEKPVTKVLTSEEVAKELGLD